MTNVLRIVVPVLLLAAIVAGAAFFFNQATDTSVTPTRGPEPAAVAPQEPKPASPPVTVTAPAVQEQGRTQVTNAPNAALANLPQGVRGRVLLPDGAPAVGVAVHLLESAMQNPIKIFLDNKLGKITPPLASVQTADDGTFALGLRQAGNSIDLRVVSDDYPEISQQQLKVRDGDWYDTGDLRLEFGVVVQGKVVEEVSRAPVPQATVFLVGSHQSHAMSVTPGRERGIPITTDANGLFKFTNGPRLGLVNLTVEAMGYATSILLNQQLKVDALNEFLIEVEPGQAIAGVTVDTDGRPIANVNVTANGLSTKTPQTATTASLADGTFEFKTLRRGPYHLMANSPSYSEAKAAMILSGDTAVKLVLGQRSAVRLKVLAANGSPVKSYRLSLKRYFAQNPLGIGNVPEFSDRTVNPSDYPAEYGGDFAAIRGLPPGEFRFQLEDSAHAKTLSPNFTVAEGGPEPEVIAQLTLGSSIMGTVVDDRGQPVAGAMVTTDLNGGIAADSGIFEVFRNMMPEKHSKAQTMTDGQGRFRINKLAFADYMVRITHANYCEGSAINIKLETEGQVFDTGVITLSLGAVVQGVTTVEGVPTGQVKVSVSMAMTEGLPAADPLAARPSRAFFNASVMSDGDGTFRLLKRVPPGTYKIVASRQSSDNPFATLIDMKQTEQQLIVAPGQSLVEFSFNLPKR
ncbi:MAG: carboxypeptidase regulatory-like domain-containing protein [Planctomycetota bacterium]